MCPPNLLHCSSTYVKTVVGNPNVKFVGSSFVSQCIMLKYPIIVGKIFDLLAFFLQKNILVPDALPSVDVQIEALQLTFSQIYSMCKSPQTEEENNDLSLFLDHFQDYSVSESIFFLLSVLVKIFASLLEEDQIKGVFLKHFPESFFKKLKINMFYDRLS
jgi:hypothetical protein